MESPRKIYNSVITITIIIILISLFFANNVNTIYLIVFFILLYILSSGIIIYIASKWEKIINKEIKKKVAELERLDKKLKIELKKKSRIKQKIKTVILNHFDHIIHSLKNQLELYDKEKHATIINSIAFSNQNFLKTLKEVEKEAKSWKYYKTAERLAQETDSLLQKLKSQTPKNVYKLKELLKNYIEILSNLRGNL